MWRNLSLQALCLVLCLHSAETFSPVPSSAWHILARSAAKANAGKTLSSRKGAQALAPACHRRIPGTSVLRDISMMGFGTRTLTRVLGLKKESGILESPILEFYGDKQRSALDKFEKFDDQIMGGISQSALLANGDGEDASAVFAGICRVEGGGFCGARMKLLSEPLDLMGYTGVYLQVRGDGKTYKMNCRTSKSSGETVYQAEFTPPADRGSSYSTIRIPFNAFRLVKRAKPVANPTPLPSGSVYQMGLVLSKFSFGEDEYNQKFQAGPFRLEVREIGAYRDSQQHTSWEDNSESQRGKSIEIKDESVISDSLEYTPQGKRRSWWSRFFVSRVRKALKKRVSQRRSDVAKDLLAQRKEGKRLSEIRKESWTAPPPKEQ